MIDPEQYRIHHVSVEEIDTPSELKLVLHFNAATVNPLVLNHATLVTLVEAFGPDTRTWVGKTVMLFTTRLAPRAVPT